MAPIKKLYANVISSCVGVRVYPVLSSSAEHTLTPTRLRELMNRHCGMVCSFF